MIPLLVLGDGPQRDTGLARIARDLTAHLWHRQDALGITVAQLGLANPQPDPPQVPWPTYLALDWENWAHDDLAYVWKHHAGPRYGVLFTIWDPARCFGTLDVEIRAQRWGYFAVDAHNVQGGISGPAGETVARYDRVLGYTRWGAMVLRTQRKEHVQYLPHGIDRTVFNPNPPTAIADELFASWYPTLRERCLLVGAVVANQPRKDLGLLFGAWALMAQQEDRCRFWLHIDKEIGAWSVPQLANDFGLSDRLIVTLQLSDQQLAAAYAKCMVTIAPGLGEGFGYPIVESLACGTPVVHGGYGGGAELLPKSEWRFPQRGSRVEGPYALVRPVYDPQDVANAAWRAITWARRDFGVASAYCQGSIVHLDWSLVWPRWEGWFKRGLSGV